MVSGALWHLESSDPHRIDAVINPMQRFITKLIAQATEFAQREPVISLFIGAGLLTLFASAYWQSQKRHPGQSFWHAIWGKVESLLWAATLIAATAVTLALLRGYLHQTLSAFQSSHGRVTQANYNAVQTIWGSEQVQRELRVQFYYDEEVVERLESEDLTKPAVLRKKTVRQFLPGNPFVSARHAVSLRQNPRKKGSALYGGYETACRFEWRLKNPGNRTNVQNTLNFPLPGARSMYDELTATLNGVDILPQMEIKESALVLTRDSQPAETLDLVISFKSRGMSTWYFQVTEAREIRDFTLALSLIDLPRPRLNYPEGCMSPTSVQSTPDGNGSMLVYRLDHALSSKGMGIALPELSQPGATTNAVLAEVERGWLLICSILLVALTLLRINAPFEAALLTVLIGTASSFGYGLLADFSDLLLGFWPAAACIILPLFGLLAWLLIRIALGVLGKALAFQLIAYGVVYPTVAGIDPDRQSLYLNICCLGLLCFVAWEMLRRFDFKQSQPVVFATPNSPA